MKKVIVLLIFFILIFTVGCALNDDNPTIDESELTTTINAEPEPVNSSKNKGVNSFSVADPENSRGLSTEKISHSYGVAKDGKPNHI